MIRRLRFIACLLQLILRSRTLHVLQKLVYKGSEVGEEFVETEYYKDLTAIDKQHHTVRL